MKQDHRNDVDFMKLALEQAKKGYEEGGVPVGAIMVEDGNVIASGHNKRVQENDPIAHGEMDCMRTAGRKPRYNNVTLYTTLSPCMMCSGTVVQFGIKRVVIGENKNFEGNIQFLKNNGVDVVLIDDDDCKKLMDKFINERPELWDEDIAGNE